MSPQIKNFELINMENFDKEDKDFIKIEVIDSFHTFRAYIDRELNQKYGVQKASASYQKEKITLYQPSSNSMPPYTTVNVTLLLRIKSKLKINIVSKEGDKMIPTENYHK